MIRSILRALRVGASVQRERETKWAGVVAMGAIFVLGMLQANGVLSDVQDKEFVEFAIVTVESILAIIAAYSQLASTKKIGLFPPDRRSSDSPDRLRDQSVPAKPDATEQEYSSRGGLPDGPFFDS